VVASTLLYSIAIFSGKNIFPLSGKGPASGTAITKSEWCCLREEVEWWDCEYFQPVDPNGQIIEGRAVLVEDPNSGSSRPIVCDDFLAGPPNGVDPIKWICQETGSICCETESVCEIECDGQPGCCTPSGGTTHSECYRPSGTEDLLECWEYQNNEGTFIHLKARIGSHVFPVCGFGHPFYHCVEWGDCSELGQGQGVE
jgi:hypothetical protein